MKPRAFHVDVDDTLARFVGMERVRVEPVIARLRKLRAPGGVRSLWSSGGGEYVRSTAAELGIENLFAAFLSKPETYIDDLPASAWIGCERSLPASQDRY